jgi:hypothetical protein
MGVIEDELCATFAQVAALFVPGEATFQSSPWQ